jgi:hypothetical protein
MAKKSRRTRREESQKPAVVSTPAAPVSVAPVPVKETPASNGTLQTARNGKVVNFAHEYFYVYHEMRNLLFITAAMFAVLVALSFVI